MTARSRVTVSSLVILHLVLKGINATGLPPRVVYEQLKVWLPEGRLSYYEVEFDLGDKTGVAAYGKEIRQMATKMQRLMQIAWA